MASKRFALYVTANPVSCQGQLSALRFAEAAITSGHQLVRVFFAGDAVIVGNALLDTPSDEPQLQQRWQTLAQTQGTELLLCSAAAQRYGIRADAGVGVGIGIGASNLAAQFSISGLGTLVESALDCDRVIHFPA